MKKFLLTATMLVGLSAVSKAQTTGRVGINTTTPAATLDVVANTTDNARPDALLVPRLSRAQLAAKDAAYTTAQNGALTFVNTLDGSAAGKTVNVTATGFYYYDAPNSVWVAVGGGAAAPTQKYEVIRGTTTVVTTPGVYTVQPTDYYIVTNSATTLVNVTFPNLTAADAGRTVYVFNNNLTAANTITNVGGSLTMNAQRGYPILWTGTQWFALTK